MRLKLILSGYLLLSFFSSVSQNYRTKVFSTDQGLPDNYIYAQLQDKEGFLWIATAKGLCRFDGQEVSKYPLPPHNTNDFIYSAACTKNGELWFGSFTGTLYHFDTKKNQLLPFPKRIQGAITHMAASVFTNKMYLATSGAGIFELVTDSLILIPGTENRQITQVELINENTLAFASSEGLMFLDLHTRGILPVQTYTVGIKQFQVLKEEKNSYLLLSEQDQIVKLSLNPKAKSCQVQKLSEQIKPILNGITSFLYEEGERCLYVVTSDEKLVVNETKTNTWTLIQEKYALGVAGCLIKDKENNLWMGTAGNGLFRFNRQEFEILDTGEGAVYAITQDNAGTYYLGGANGIRVMDEEWHLKKTITQIGSKTIKKVNALHLDAKGILWIGCETQGLILLDLKSGKEMPLSFSTIPNITVNAINGNFRNSFVQVCTNLDGVYNYDAYVLQNHFSVENSLLHNNVFNSLRARYGKIYYATHNTAFNFSKGNHVFEISLYDPKLNFDFNCFADNKEGGIVIGTNGDGLYSLNDTVIKPFEFNSELESKYCIGLLFDKNDDLWLMERNKLYKFHPRERVLQKMKFNGSEKVTIHPNAIYETNKGEVLIGTDKNLLRYKTGSGSVNTNLIPKSYLIKVKLFDSLLDISQQPELKYGKYTISFEYSALSLRNSEDVMYKYILEGRDENWSEAIPTRKVEFSNLSEGDYTFKLLALNAEGFSEKVPLSFRFVIKPPFWKQPVFWVSLALIFVVLLFLFIRVRTASLLRAKLLLEKRVAEQTKELQEERELILQKQQVIEEQNTYITQSITYARRLQFATLPPLVTMQQYLPDSFIIYKPKDIVSGDFYWMSIHEDKIYVAAADCTGHGVPGAMLTMVCSNALEKTIHDDALGEIGDKLARTFEIISATLAKSGEIINDGMDISIVCINRKEMQLSWSGEGNPLYYFSEDQLHTIKSDTPKLVEGEIVKTYTTHTVQLKLGDTFYLLSDGYIDQFGGPLYKRFQKKQFIQTLEAIQELNMKEQKEVFENKLKEWQGDLKQTDDICLIGIRI